MEIPIQNIPIELRQAIEERIRLDTEACQKWGITMEQVAEIREYAQRLKRLNKHYNDATITKLVAKHFNITLTDGPDNKLTAIIGKKKDSGE